MLIADVVTYFIPWILKHNIPKFSILYIYIHEYVYVYVYCIYV